MQVEIGDLRHRITFQKLTTSVNENGFEVETWEDFKTVWAAVSNLHGREYFAAAAVQAENTVKFTIRYLTGLDTTMRIVFQGKQYNITAIDNIKYQNRYLEIKALEVVSSG
ncbi:phage head closure protein [Desulfoscipio gibsoniae]|jgi:SPP1 family predicted phage head-tail adaptor|uniref:Phage head-tail adaptor, putative, SPP1 family n=1 Tax=Desulfoscipio gibsoniae DSM 7213 TaxID=767817 RepID=R4KM15_9FIRM|nr:phage head closure protein [Desulfoscipio gibsoniae]AGL03729.1 phage head-tail adaptor, putative, SPP1 family [Desulfoscipio gibsoniae DSM 7213]